MIYIESDPDQKSTLNYIEEAVDLLKTDVKLFIVLAR
jgi:hypothetical protein